MRSTLALSLAALAGSALAIPYYPHHGEQVNNVVVEVVTVVHTVYVTEGDAQPTPTPIESAYVPVVTTVVYEAPAPAPTSSSSAYVAPAPEPTPTPSPVYVAPAPVPTPEAPAPVAAPASGYMSVVATWRAKLGLKALTNSPDLEANALKCVTDSNGAMVHELNPGTYAQVLAPGGASDLDFEHVFVGGWLCEVPSTPGLDGACVAQSEGWSYEGQTGHNKILTDPSYSKIGCALKTGIWACDLS